MIKRGFSWPKAAVWMLVLGPLGLPFGFLGQSNPAYLCTRCGKRWPVPRKKSLVEIVLAGVIVIAILVGVYLLWRYYVGLLDSMEM